MKKQQKEIKKLKRQLEDADKVKSRLDWKVDTLVDSQKKLNAADKASKQKLEELRTKAKDVTEEVERLRGDNTALAEELRRLKILGAGGIQGTQIGQSSYFSSDAVNVGARQSLNNQIHERIPIEEIKTSAEGGGLSEELLDRIMEEDD